MATEFVSDSLSDDLIVTDTHMPSSKNRFPIQSAVMLSIPTVCAAMSIGLLSTWSALNVQALEIPKLTGPENFWECVLDKVPGASYAYDYQKRIRACEKEFPEHDVIKKDTRGGGRIYNRPKVKECIAKHTEDTVSRKAQLAIRIACMKTVKED